MKTIVVHPKSEAEFKVMKNLLDLLKVKTTLLSREEAEDVGLLARMNRVNRKKTVSRTTIMNILEI